MWNALKAKAAEVADRRIEGMLDADRAASFAVQAGDMRMDYAKTNIDAATRDMLIEMLETTGVAAKRDAMFGGMAINETEGRAVLHTALRNLDGGPVMVEGADVMPEVLATLKRMDVFAEDVRSGKFKGQGGQITDVVNIGIGGSDLGPAMATLALAPYHDGPRCHFVSNVDPADIAQVLRSCDPATTLVIVASKTFTTIETMTNARTAQAWMGEKVKDVGAQFAALSTSAEKTAAMGIAPERVFGFEDWVGGRYSMWGPIGLSLTIAVGKEAFHAFLRGAQAMDVHFKAADWHENMPALLALVGIWHNQGCGHASRAVLPYDNNLSRLPAYLQQLEMESNGKSVTTKGEAVQFHTMPVLWGGTGTRGQHAYHQLLHQGTRAYTADFITVRDDAHQRPAHHSWLVANALAQSQAMAAGQMTPGEPHKQVPGNHPTTTIVLDELGPGQLGTLLAVYEHKVFCQGVIWDINSFDQWGVELGKQLAKPIFAALTEPDTARPSVQDAATQGLINHMRK